jgi:hypothetical protein
MIRYNYSTQFDRAAPFVMLTLRNPRSGPRLKLEIE